METDKNLDQAIQQDTGTEAPKGENQSNDLESRLAELEKRYKSEISGLNRKISDTEKEKQALDKKVRESELEKLSDKERAEEEIRIAKENIAELKKTEMEFITKDRLNNLGLSKESVSKLIEIVKGNDESEIDKIVEILGSVINAESEIRKEKTINQALGGTAPKIGLTTNANSLQTYYDNAKSKGDTALMVSIKRQAGNEGINII